MFTFEFDHLDGLSQSDSEDKLQNWSIIEISAKVRVCIQVKISKRLKLLYSVPFIKKTLVNQVYIQFDYFDWLSQFFSEWRQTSKLVNFQGFSYGPTLLSR